MAGAEEVQERACHPRSIDKVGEDGVDCVAKPVTGEIVSHHWVRLGPLSSDDPVRHGI